MCAVKVKDLSTLLYGPGKAFFGKALVGTAASLAVSSQHPVSCSSYFRPPYDADIWQAENAFHDEVLSVPGAQTAAAKDIKAQRPVGWKALKHIAGTKNALLTLVRNETLSCVLVLHAYFEALSAEEDLALAEDREPRHVPFPDAQLKVAARKGLLNACLDWATQFMRSVLDWTASEMLPIKMSTKLVKDLRASVKRKAGYPFYYRGARVVKTSLLSEATLYLADFVVSCSMECYRACCAAKVSWRPVVRQLGLRCLLHSARCSAALLATSAANGLGSMVPYKRGLAMFLLAQLSAFLVNSAFFSLTARLAGAPPPPPSLPPAALPPGQQGHAAAAAAEERAAEDQGPAMVDPFLVLNAQMPRGGAAVAAQAALQAGGAAAAAGAVAQIAAAAGAAGGEEADDRPQQAQQQQERAAGQDVGVQADAPPEPVPRQRRRVIGGPRLPDRPARRVVGAAAPAPQAPHTPQFREPRAASPAPDSEDIDLSAAAVASSAGAAAAAATPERSWGLGIRGAGSEQGEGGEAWGSAARQEESEHQGGAAGRGRSSQLGPSLGDAEL